MGRLRKSVPGLSLLLVLAVSSGCRGLSSAPPPPPPPQPDFTIGFSQTSLSLEQGATAPAVSLSVTAVNGFSGSVQVALGGLPTGATASPPTPLNIAAGASTPLLFSATPNAATGSFTVVATGTSGALSHPANLTLTIQAGVAASLPRTTFLRTDSVPAMDDPPGEPRHRRLAYDPAHQLLFVANRAMNRVEVLSTASASRIGQINVAGASSADLSSDGSTIWVGSMTEVVAVIDSTALQVKSWQTISGLQPQPNVLFDRPEEVLAMANGKCMVRLRQSQGAEALLALWDPTANALTNLTSTEPQLFQNGLGAMARTGDHTKLLVAASDSSGEVAVYDSNGSVIAGPHGLGSGTIPLVAANQDGSRFAVDFASNGASQVLLLDGSLSQVGTYAASSVNGMVFSADGQFLYVSENSGTPPLITALDGHSLNVLGHAPDLWIAGRRSEIEDLDATKLIFGISNRGVSFVDAATLTSLPATAPAFTSAPVTQPSEGPNAGGTATVVAGENFESTAQVLLGGQAATAVQVGNASQIHATSPPNGASGAVNVGAYFPSGWLALAPDAFSYGPQVREILPNAATPQGGDLIQIYGYGFGSDVTKLSVRIGGASATVQRVESITSIASSLGLDAAYPFPLERITLQAPAGTAGSADVAITSAAGSVVAAKAFQYVQSENFYAKPSFNKFIFYDQSRQWLYLSDIDHVDVFDLAVSAYHANALEPPGGPPPSSALRGMTLTPDGTQLVVADFGAQNVYLLDPSLGSGTRVAVGGVPGFGDSGPSRVAATSTQSVFVGLTAESSGSAGCTSCLGQLDLSANPPTIQPASQREITSLSGAPLVQADSKGDQVFVAFGNAPGGPLAAWNASAPSEFQTVNANEAALDMGTSADGNEFVLASGVETQIRGADFFLSSVIIHPDLEQIPGRVFVPGVTLHPSGALLYEPFLTAQPGGPAVHGGIDIVDARSGVLRLRLFLAQQFMTDVDGMHGSFLAIDENGQRLFAITSTDGSAQNAGVTIVSLASVPLGIGSISPSQGVAAGGAMLSIRGSGFQAGATVTIGGKSAKTTFKDMNTLMVVTPALTVGTQRVTVTNPDGESVSWDAAFTAS